MLRGTTGPQKAFLRIGSTTGRGCWNILLACLGCKSLDRHLNKNVLTCAYKVAIMLYIKDGREVFALKKDENFNIRIGGKLKREFYRVVELNAQNPSELVRGWIEDYVAKYGDAKKSKVMVSCPHCGHLTHVDVPTDRKGQLCGACNVVFVYPWVEDEENSEIEKSMFLE